MILVTGAAGYIGSHFLRRILSLRKETEIIAVDNLCTGHKEALPQDERVKFHCLDLGDLDSISSLLVKHKVEAVVHFAGSCYVGESESDPFKYYKNNLLESLRLFESMNASGVKRLVFSSSCATYGIPEFLPLTEEHPQKPINIYGHTKLMVESLLSELRRSLGFSFACLRYFNAAGADESMEIGESHDPETHLIPNALKALADENKELQIFGDDYDTRDGTCIRDYVHVNDLSDAHIAALELLESKPCGIGVNLGTGYGASVKEIVELSEKISGRKLRARVLPRRPGDPPVLVASSERARELLNWVPKHGLESILASAWNWELNRRY